MENTGPVICWSTLNLVWKKSYKYGGHKLLKIRPCVCQENTQVISPGTSALYSSEIAHVSSLNESS